MTKIKEWLRYNKTLRWALVRVSKRQIGEHLYSKLLKWLYPSDCMITFYGEKKGKVFSESERRGDK